MWQWFRGLEVMKPHTDLQHKCVWRVDKDGGVFPGRRLQAKLGIRRLGVVGEGDGAGQLAIVQHLLVVLGKVDVTLWFELESALETEREREREGERERGDEKKTSKVMWETRWIRATENCVCVCVCKLNTQNGVCLIAAWAVCKQHSISLMNTVLTRPLIQLAQNKRWRGGSGCAGERDSGLQI